MSYRAIFCHLLSFFCHISLKIILYWIVLPGEFWYQAEDWDYHQRMWYLNGLEYSNILYTDLPDIHTIKCISVGIECFSVGFKCFSVGRYGPRILVTPQDNTNGCKFTKFIVNFNISKLEIGSNYWVVIEMENDVESRYIRNIGVFVWSNMSQYRA